MKRFLLSLIICSFALFNTSCEELTQALASASGCMLQQAPNFNSAALLACTTDCVGDQTGSNCCCEEIIYGCTDSTAINYDPSATNMCTDIAGDQCCIYN